MLIPRNPSHDRASRTIHLFLLFSYISWWPLHGNTIMSSFPYLGIMYRRKETYTIVNVLKDSVVRQYNNMHDYTHIRGDAFHIGTLT